MLTTIHGLEAVKFALSGDFPRSFESGGVSALFFETATKQADQIAMESARATGSACRIILVVMKRVTTSNADMEQCRASRACQRG